MFLNVEELSKDELLFWEYIARGEDYTKKVQTFFETMCATVLTIETDLVIASNVVVSLIRCLSLKVKDDWNEVDESIYRGDITRIFKWYYELIVGAVQFNQNLTIHFGDLEIPRWLLKKHRPKVPT